MYSSFIFTEERLGIKLNALKDERGNIWFIGKEVAEILGYKDAVARKTVATRIRKNHKKTLSSKDVKVPVKVTLKIPNRGLTIIDECEFYKFVLQSEMPNAEIFSDWVCGEVLPSLRKNNYYIDKENINTPQLDNLQKELDTLRKEKDVYIKDSNFYSIRDIRELLGGSIEIDTDKLKEKSYELGLSIKQEKGYFNSKPVCYNRYHFLVWVEAYEDIFEITSDEKLRIKNSYDELNNNQEKQS